MKPSVRQVVWLMTLAVLALGAAGGAAPKSKSIQWLTDFKKAQTVAKKQKKIMMVDFYTDWCGFCKKLDRDTYPSPKVVNLARQFVAVKINPEKSQANEALRIRYDVSGFPTILFLDASGRKIHEIPGYAPPDVFAEEMRTALKKAKG